MKTACSALLALTAVPLVALAQGYPSKPIRVVVPYAAGGAVDVLARATGMKLSEFVGQPVIVENRAGGNATIGADNVAKSPPDGYSVTFVSTVHYMVPFFSKTVPYDPVKDFTPVINLAAAPNLLVTAPSLPVSSMKDLIEYAKKNPAKLHYGTPGVGTMQHLGGIMLGQMAGISIDHVPYKGGNLIINDLLAGQIPLAILTATTVMPHVRAGKVRALGLIEGKRYSGAAGVPSIVEMLPGYRVPDTWFGVLGPAGLPAPIVARLNAEYRKTIAAPDVRARLDPLGFELTGNTPEEFLATVRSDVDLVRKAVNAAGIKPE